MKAALQSALGLTTTEAENAFALSVVETNGIDHRIIAREKAHTLKRNGLLEVVAAVTGLDDIGGLDHLKEWLKRRSGAFSASAKAYGLPAPKGLLIVGIPGTGKSLTAKATAGAFGLPLLRLDMGCVFGGITRTVPLAQLMDGQIAALRHWAKGRAREAGNGDTPGPRNGRRISREN